jgi:hypothetical protein
MSRLSWRGACVPLLAALTVVTALSAGPAAVAQPIGQAPASTCPVPLKGYRPVAALSYISQPFENQVFGLDSVKEKANGDISGISDLAINSTQARTDSGLQCHHRKKSDRNGLLGIRPLGLLPGGGRHT